MKLFAQSGAATADPLTAYRAALDAWGTVLEPLAKAGQDKVDTTDRRFAAPQWEHPVFDLIRQSYQVMSEHMLAAADQLDGLPENDKAKMGFALRSIIDAMSPRQFAVHQSRSAGTCHGDEGRKPDVRYAAYDAGHAARAIDAYRL